MKAERARVLLLAMALAVFSSGASADSTWDAVAARLRAASLPAAQAQVIADQAHARGLAPNDVESWAARLQGLAQSGIPPALAAERLAEGLAKGVPADRIDRALAELGDNLGWLNGLLARITARAERLANPAQNELALRAGEAGLRAGLERTQLERCLAPGPLTLEQTIALAHAAGSMRAAGIDQTQIASALHGAGSAGVRARDVQQLEQRFVAALAAGRPAQSAFEELRLALSRMKDAADAARSAAQREELRQEMRDTLRAPGELGSRPGGISPGAGHGKGLR